MDKKLSVFLVSRNFSNSETPSGWFFLIYKVFEKKKFKIFTPTLSRPPLRGRVRVGGRGFREKIPLNILVGVIFFLGLLQDVPCGSGEFEGRDILFYAGFDDSIMATFACGQKEPVRTEGGISYVEGKKGRALVVGYKDKVVSRVLFYSKDNINLEQGTIEMWIRLIDWSVENEGYQFFFSCGAEKGTITIFKQKGPGLWGRIGMYEKGESEEYKLVDGKFRDITSGKWHHIVMSWEKGGEMRLYTDGKLCFQQKIPEEWHPNYKMQDWYAFSIGGISGWAKEMEGLTAIDEFYIYNRVLTDAEVKAAYYRP